MWICDYEMGGQMMLRDHIQILQSFTYNLEIRLHGYNNAFICNVYLTLGVPFKHGQSYGVLKNIVVIASAN